MTKQKCLRDADGQFVVPIRSTPFVTYDDSDVELLRYCRQLRFAQRGDGKTSRVVSDAIDLLADGKNVLLLAGHHEYIRHVAMRQLRSETRITVKGVDWNVFLFTNGCWLRIMSPDSKHRRHWRRGGNIAELLDPGAGIDSRI